MYGKSKSKLGLVIYASMAISFLSFFPRGQKLAEFKEPFKYITMTADKDNIYIADKKECVVHIYSRNDFHHVAQFGRKGQGPEDFEFIGLLRVFPDHIFIDSGRKVSYFSKKGDFLKTVTPPYPATGSYIPLGSNFAGKRYLPEDPRETWSEIMVELFDSTFSKIEDLYLARLNKIESFDFKRGKKNLLVVGDCFKLEVYEDKLFVGNTAAGLFFSVFDNRGKKLYDINLSYDKRSVTAKDKNAILEEVRKAVGEQRFNRGSSQFEYIFPTFYPAYSDFTVADERIYVFMYKRPREPQEVMILDLRGNPLKSVIVPLAKVIFTDEFPYCVYKGNLYYMSLNEESYKWELYFEKLE